MCADIYEMLPDIIAETWAVSRIEIDELTEATVAGWRHKECLQ